MKIEQSPLFASIPAEVVIEGACLDILLEPYWTLTFSHKVQGFKISRNWKEFIEFNQIQKQEGC